MDTARQIIRWALPGWTAILFWTGFIAVNTFLHGQSQTICLGILQKVNDLLLPLAGIAIPLGFIIYQLYYWVYWDVPVPYLFRGIFINPRDRGREVLKDVEGHVDFKQIFDHALIDAPKVPIVKKWGLIPYKSRKVMMQYRQNWHLADSAWYLALSDERYKNTAEILEKRHQFLSDIYHSLSACYTALAVAYLGYISTFGYISLVEAHTFLSRLTLLLSRTTATQGLIVTTIATILKATILRLVSFTINATILYSATRMFRSGRTASYTALTSLKHNVITNVMLSKPTKLSGEVTALAAA